MKNYKIYCFSDKRTFGKKLDFLKSNVVYLKDEYNLLNNNENKIIVYDPDYAGWQFPNEILKYKNIKAICLGTTTASYIDENICKKLNIPILTIPKYSTDSVAEYMVMLMFALAKKLPLQIKANFRQDFDESFTQMQLRDKRVGIIGLGNIGLRFAEICDGIGMHVYYWDRNKKDVKYKYEDLTSLFAKCDVVLVALATNKETTKIVTDDMLRFLKKDAILLSVGGTNLFNHDLVVEMLRANKLFGYGLEIADKGVFNFVGNAMVTSEYAWFTKESQEARIKLWVENIKSFIS